MQNQTTDHSEISLTNKIWYITMQKLLMVLTGVGNLFVTLEYTEIVKPLNSKLEYA